jgi:hypothetical protein
MYGSTKFFEKLIEKTVPLPVVKKYLGIHLRVERCT